MQYCSRVETKLQYLQQLGFTFFHEHWTHNLHTYTNVQNLTANLKSNNVSYYKLVNAIHSYVYCDQSTWQYEKQLLRLRLVVCSDPSNAEPLECYEQHLKPKAANILRTDDIWALGFLRWLAWDYFLEKAPRVSNFAEKNYSEVTTK